LAYQSQGSKGISSHNQQNFMGGKNALVVIEISFRSLWLISVAVGV
jgi:hypothetical protein